MAESASCGMSRRSGTVPLVEEQGIYRSEVMDIISGLLDVKWGVLKILRYIENEEDGEEAEEDL